MKLNKKTENEKPQSAAQREPARGGGRAKNEEKNAALKRQSAPNKENGRARQRQGGAQKPAAAARIEGGKEQQAKAKGNAKSLKIRFLGGVGEIGKNMTAFEYGKDIIVVDAGLSFPSDDMPGIDLVIPDITYLEENKSRIRGIVLTHGHEDHIGGLPYLLKEISAPVFGTKLTLTLAENKLAEHRLNNVSLNCVKAGSVVKLGCFSVEFINVNHSIAGAVALSVTTPVGVVFHSGDYKIDFTPINGDYMDLTRIAEIGKKGVLLLMAESTNVERPGYTMSERKVGESFEQLFRKAHNKRIVVATFASNIHRVQQIIDVAQSRGRKVAVTGRSLENLVQVGQDLGYLNVPENILIPIDAIKRYPDDKLVIITTGSQGEPMSALTRIAFGEHRKVNIGPNDYVIISATPIPGNEKMVGNVVNELMKHNVEVIYEKMYEVHVSGHACQEELKLMMGIVKPQYFIPVHGEQKHLQKHAGLAMSMGYDMKHIYLGNIGEKISLSKTEMKQIETVPAGEVYVDGLGVGDVGNIVLNDRKHLSQDGIIIVVATLDAETGDVVSGPDVVSRGFVYVKENEDLMNKARDLACHVIYDYYDVKGRDWNTVKSKLRDEISHLMYEKTKRSPMVLPILMEI